MCLISRCIGNLRITAHSWCTWALWELELIYLIHWWIRQKVSKIICRAFSINCFCRGVIICLILRKSCNNPNMNSVIKENFDCSNILYTCSININKNDPEPARYSYAKRNHSPERSYTFPTSPAPYGNQTWRIDWKR